MSLAVVYSRAIVGIEAPLVRIEVHLTNGFPAFHMVGLPEAAVRESKHRVQSAILNCQFEFPVKRITVNLAPADLPKEGGRFDLPIALGILAASKQISLEKFNDYEFAGELALTGELNSIKGGLSFAMQAAKANRQLILPEASAEEACLINLVTVYSARHLLEVCSHLSGETRLTQKTSLNHSETFSNYPDLLEVYGQSSARRALEIAASGDHSLLFCGPPGTGKTMLASRLISILPELNSEQAQEVAAIYSISRLGFQTKDWKRRPFRSPHHTSSAIALVGGSKPPLPGEISLAHHGVLFLDELPEFNRQALECLREPLESGCIHVSRSGYQARFPSLFQLIAAMNPCPCGYLGHHSNLCHCSSQVIQKYKRKISGPFLDRMDLYVEVNDSSLITEGFNYIPVGFQEAGEARASSRSGAYIKYVSSEWQQQSQSLKGDGYKTKIEDSKEVRTRVCKVRERQLNRQQKLNSKLNSKEIETYCQFNKNAFQFLQKAVDHYYLSNRAFVRLTKLARTLADMQESLKIEQEHILEALSYRLNVNVLSSLKN